MVYLHFPSNLTEEELMLQAKYQKLKRKKKAAIKQKTTRPEPERTPVKVSKGPKMEARDAREVAKKLIKSGAISPIVKNVKKTENEGFKRPSRFRGLERKLLEERTVAGYQPFASSPTDDRDNRSSSYSPNKFKNLYDSFVTGKILENKSSGLDNFDILKPDKPKQGNTIFVSGNKINEEFLRKTFASYGPIVDISMESEKNRGFVTFKNSESSEKAISEMDSKIISGTLLKVTLARRQIVNPSNELMSNNDWRYIAGTSSHKGNYSDKREKVDYADDLFSPSAE